MRESQYQRRLIETLEQRFPGCVILKNDPEYINGVPDLLILFNDRWAALEVKASERSPVRPLQPYWIERLDGMSFAAFIYPSNEQDVLNGLEQALAI